VEEDYIYVALESFRLEGYNGLRRLIEANIVKFLSIAPVEWIDVVGKTFV
jgi:hypothetical protein